MLLYTFTTDYDGNREDYSVLYASNLIVLAEDTDRPKVEAALGTSIGYGEGQWGPTYGDLYDKKDHAQIEADLKAAGFEAHFLDATIVVNR